MVKRGAKKRREARKENALDALTFSFLRFIKPPENITVDEWAAKYRFVSGEAAAEPGIWRNERTPYLVEPMRAFTDDRVRDIVMVASSQVGKSELQLNILGYIATQDPGSILYIFPNLPEAKKFSRQRVSPMIRDSEPVNKSFSPDGQSSKTRTNTVLQKTFQGGTLILSGTKTPAALASMPIRYVMGDERDRWAATAGSEGDPWELARARQTTFKNAKSIQVSTPTIKGASAIEDAFYTGTQERWCTECPACGKYGEMCFEAIKFSYTTERVRGKDVYTVDRVEWECPSCVERFTEHIMKRQPSKWIADNPDALDKNKTRSFWLTSFASPWATWESIIKAFMDAKDDPERLQVVFNTQLGKLWEQRAGMQTEEELFMRREEYKDELPAGVLVLTMGVDTQDDRLEYEIVGWGEGEESWGIKRGFIFGVPDTDEVWAKFDEILNHSFQLEGSERKLKISMTLIDSGGHYTQEIYKRCYERQGKRVYALKGASHYNRPFIAPPSKVPIERYPNKKAWLWVVNVSAGKAAIMYSLVVQQEGPKFAHFPLNPELGYSLDYFEGLLSEVEVKKNGRLRWEKLPGRLRNEALDCRNYALAALRIVAPNYTAIKLRLAERSENENKENSQKNEKTSAKHLNSRKKGVRLYGEL